MKINEWVSRCAADRPQCVEVRLTDGNHVEMRQSGKPDVVVTISVDEWHDFVDGVKAGTFEA